MMTSKQFQFTSQILEKETISNDLSNSLRFYYLKPSNQVENAMQNSHQNSNDHKLLLDNIKLFLDLWLGHSQTEIYNFLKN